MTGLEPAISGSTVPSAPGENTTNRGTFSTAGPPGAVAGAAKGGCPDGLARVVEAWPTLPESFRRAVLAMIDASG